MYINLIFYMKRTEIINGIIKKHGFKSYLEIGVNDMKNFNAIECDSKIGVDPNVEGEKIITQTSNEFYASEGGLDYYDCIFIDGDHTYKQSKNDLENSLQHLKEGGLILLHDTNPNNIKEITPNNNGKAWCGEVWKTVLEAKWDGYVIQTIPDDYGLTIITGEQKKFEGEVKQVTPQEFIKNKSILMNFVSYNDYIKSCDKPKEKDTNDIQIDDINDMTDEELKDFYKTVYGKKPKGRFIRETVIDRLIN